MKRFKLLLLAVLCAAAAGCRDEPEPGPAESGPAQVLADYQLGSITHSDIDQFILSQAPEKRWQPEADPQTWYTSIIRRIAVDKLLLDEALLVGADQDPAFLALARAIERNAYSNHYISQSATAPPAPDESELRAYYDAHREQNYQLPERRRVYHIFKQFRQDQDRTAQLAAIAQLRARIHNGENIEILARQHSDSESRHYNGALGLLARGRYTPDFDRVVFALPANTPSEPITTADGVHLFLVSEILEARTYAFEEVRSAILQRVLQQQRLMRLAQAAAELPLPQPDFFPSRTQLMHGLRNSNHTGIVLQLGDFQLSLGQFQEQLNTIQRQIGASHIPDLPFQLLEEIRHREIIYQHLRANGLPDIAQNRLDAEKEQQLIDFFIQRKLTAYLSQQAQQLRQHYENNRMRFASPLKVHIQQLTLPRGADAAQLMTRLEGSRALLDAGTYQLQDLAVELGATVQDFGFVTAAKLGTLDPQALRFAFLLQPGEHSPPYSAGDSLRIFKVRARQEPKILPLAMVRDRVIQDYLAYYSAQVYSELSAQLLEQARFRTYPDRFFQLPPLPSATVN